MKGIAYLFVQKHVVDMSNVCCYAETVGTGSC